MINTEALTRMLILDEDSRQFPYSDSVGKLTVGIGRNLTDKGLSSDEILYLFNNDVREVEHELSFYAWFTNLDDVRRLVIADMAFNLGTPKLLRFNNTINALKIGDYQVAADEMLDSKWAKQVGKRAGRLASMMRTGEIHPAYLA